MATLGSLVIQLQADLGRLQSDMGKAVGIVDKSMGSIKRAANLAKIAIGGIVGGLSVAGVASGIKQIVDYGDKIRDMAIATGATVEQLSFLDYAASQSGGSVESLTAGVARLQKNLTEVAKGDGKQAAEALRTLGLSAQELSRLDLVSQLSELGTALSQVTNPAERAATAQALFGRGARELLPLLLEGERGIAGLADRFVELGGVITTGQANKFDALNDSLGDLRAASRGAGAAIAEALSPALTTLFETIANGVPFITDTLAHFVEDLVYTFTQAQKTFIEARIALDEFFSFKGAARQNLAAPNKDIEEAKRLQRVLDQIRQDSYDRDVERQATLRKKLTAGGATFGEIDPGVDSEGIAKAEKDAARRAQREADAIRQLSARLVAEHDVTEAARVRFELEEGAYQEFTAAGKERLAQLASELDLQKDSADVSEYLRGIEQQRREDAEKAVQARNDEIRTTIESLRTPVEIYTAAVQRLLDLGIGGENLQRGIAQAGEALEAAQEKANETSDAVRDLGLTFSSAFEEAVLGGEKLSDVLQGLADDIARIVLRKTVTEPLAGQISGLFDGGGIGDFFSGLFNNATGGLYRVGGSSGEHPVAFNARAGEVVAVGTGMSGDGGLQVVVINNSPERVQPRERVDSSGRRQLEITVGDLTAGNVGAGRFAGFGILPPLASR